MYKFCLWVNILDFNKTDFINFRLLPRMKILWRTGNDTTVHRNNIAGTTSNWKSSKNICQNFEYEAWLL